MKWTYCDNLVVYYYYRFRNCGTKKEHQNLREIIAELVNKDEGSVRMKIQNYNSLANKTSALNHYSKDSVEIYHTFSMMDDEAALRIMAEECDVINNLIK